MLGSMDDLEPFDLAAIKRRAEVRRTWAVGVIGDPVPWCRFCKVRLPGETQQEHESIEHQEGCPVPEALRHRAWDFDLLLAEVERLRGRHEP